MLLAFAAGLRAVTMLGYRPGRIYYVDSYEYLELALHPRPSQGFRNIGYPLFLKLLMPLHSIELVVAVQHLMGLTVGVMVYALLRRRSVSVWAAVPASVPVLFDAQMLQLEHAVLSDMLFIFLVIAAVTTLMWSPGHPSPRAAAAAGLLLAMAALTRSVGLPLLLLVLAYLVARRIGWSRLAIAALAGLLPLILYASWYEAENGKFTLSGVDGVSLWARTMTFADCDRIRPPQPEEALCPNGSWQDAASEYVWAPDSSLNRMPGGAAADNDLARSFALHAMAAQPLDYLQAVAHDVSLAFHWTPARHPQRVTPAFGFKKGRWEPTGVPASARRTLTTYDPGASGVYYSAEPYAGFLRGYQYPAYLRGPFLALILLAGTLGLRRGSFLPWATAITLLVLPVALLDFDHRYVLPVVPAACLAAALAMPAQTVSFRKRTLSLVRTTRFLELLIFRK
ncbi:phospholipid carrier-dependent glycosyltransferase [Actinomadura barringtoniae]|uniref:Phospholipid carrier-dependent glycosyltransferase n=1 Tax=Actinomadura barringtoniae TaxID=1427535 RepID=A0A939PS92_9ACTN|nr:phospholipid carrier-dependent glycosyltransferase [Actinomadura barringtoniae]MBO2454159.1 phospholipid carrier-dependent glycosyltransferase [Actinomadura barringtoniae]